MPILETSLILGGAALVTLRGGPDGDDLRAPFVMAGPWVFPLPIVRGYKPEVSDGFQARLSEDHRQHLGVDLMYRRTRKGKVTGPETAIDNIDGTSLYWMPKGQVAYAAQNGDIWSSGYSPTFGHNIVIDHGKPWCSFYQHLSTLLVPKDIERGMLNGRKYPVKAGDPIGIVGGAVKGYGLRHLHFELWYRGGRDGACDPHKPPGGVPPIEAWNFITQKEG